MDKPELRLQASLASVPLRAAAQTPGAGIRRQLRASTALRLMLRATAWSGVSIAIMSSANANPTGGTVVSGQATINQSNANRTEITQTTDRAAINWQSFNIGAKQSVVISQPSSSSWELERVIGPDPSRIAGQLSSNGNVALVNPNGLFFSRGSQIDVHGLVATTADIRDSDFNQGRFNFSIPSPNPKAQVVNEGTITVADHGLAALVAPGTANSGTITAKFGRVMLAGAQTFTVDLYGDGLLSFDVTSKVKGANVTNTGRLEADGGVIQLSASTVDDIVTGVVNMGGTVAANSVGAKTGTITADAGANGQLNVTGQVGAQGANAGETGGSIALTGGNVSVASGATIDASGSAGGGSIKVGGGFHGTDSSIANAQTTTIAAGATLDASAIDKGDGGSIAVWSDKATAVHGTIRAKGGAKGGHGGFVETSSHGHLDIAGAKVDTSAPQGAAGTWLLDPDSVTITGTTDVNEQGTGTFADPFVATDTTQPSTLNVTDIENGLKTGGNVLVQTSTGNIDVASTITAPVGSGNLGLKAGGTGNIVIGSVNGTAADIDFSASAAGSVFLQAGGTIGQGPGGGTIKMGGGVLQLAAGAGIGSSTTATATTGVTNLAASTGTGGVAISNTGSDITVAQISVDATGNVGTPAGTTFGTVTGVSATSGDIALQNAGSITVSQNVTATAGNVSLTATSAGKVTVAAAVSGAAIAVHAAGAINQTAGTITGTTSVLLDAGGLIGQTGGSITTPTLTGDSTGDAALTGANAIAALNGFTTGGGNLTLADTGPLAVTADVLAGTGSINISTTGLLTLGGATTALNLTGSAGTTLAGAGVTLAQNVTTNGVTSINAGTGAYTDGGNTLSTSNHTLSLTATTLALTAATTSLDSGTAATTITAAAGEGLSVGAGTTAATLGIADGKLDLIHAGGGLTLATTGTNDITVDGPVTDHGGFTSLALNAGGSVAVNSDITATHAPLQLALASGAAGAVTLQANKKIATDGGSLSIAAGSGGIGLNSNNTLDTTGTTDGNLSLSAPKLTLSGTINAGTATLTLTATDTSAAGTIAEANATVTAGVLTGSSGGTTKLRDTPSDNAIGDIRDFTVANNDFNFTDIVALSLDGTFKVPGTMTLNAPSITQKPGGTITAGTLTGETSTGNASFAQPGNAVATLGDYAITTGNFTLTDGIALTVTGNVAASNGNIALTAPGPELKITTGTLNSTGTTTLAAPTGTALVAGAADAAAPANSLLVADGSLAQITAGGGVVLATSGADIFANGVTAHGGFKQLTLNSGNNIAIDGGLAVSTTAGTLDLIALGTITENTGGTVAAATLTGTSGSDVLLTKANAIGDLGAFTVTAGSFNLNDGATALTIDGAVSVPGLLTLNAGSITELTGGTIAAGTLTGGATTGDVKLTNTNTVKDLGAFTIAAGHDFTLNDGTTALGIDGAVSVPGTLTLNAGSITENGVGTITAGKLAGTSGGDVLLLANANAVGDLGAFALTTGNFNLNDGATALTIDGAVKVPGTLTLNAGSITENAGGAINAGTLTGQTSAGDASLNQSNQIATLGSFTSANNFSLTDGESLNVTGPVAAFAGLLGNLTLDVTGDLGIAGNVSSFTVALKASGAINQTGGTISGPGVKLTAGTTISQTGGLISAGALSGSSGGDVSLTQPGNAITDIGGFTTGGGKFTLNDSLALTVFNAPLATGGGDLSLTVPGLTLNLPTSLDSGSTGKTTITALGEQMSVGAGTGGGLGITDAELGQINAGSGLTLATQTGQNILVDGSITAHPGFNNLALNSGGNIDIGGSSNVNVNSLALNAAGTVTEDTAFLIIPPLPPIPLSTGSITASILTGTSVGGTGLTGNNQIAQLGPFTNTGPGNIALNDAQPLNIAGLVSTGATVSLTVTGAITETGAGAIAANTLAGSSNGGATLNGANQIANLGSFTNNGLGNFSLTDGASLTVSGGVSGGTSGGNNLTLNSAGNLVVANNLAATNAVTLTASGSITQTAGTISGLAATLNAGGTISQSGGVINVTQLSGNSTGGTTLDQANAIVQLGPFTNTGAGGFTLNDALPLTVTNPVDAGTGNLAITVAGSLGILANLTAGTNIALSASGAITQSGGTVTGKAVTLAAGGSISQTGGAISATTLTGSSTGGANLGQANQIDDLAGFTNTGGGGFTLGDARALTVTGAVNAGTGNLSLGVTGPLGLAADLTAGGTVSLTATGTITQTGGIISANALNGSSAAGTTLDDANHVANLIGFTNSGAGGFSLTDAQSLTVGASAVNAGSDNLALRVTGNLGIAADLTAGKAVTLDASGAITQSAGTISGATVTVTAGGAIEQDFGGAITAGTLTGSSGGNALFFGSNHINTLGAFTTPGSFLLLDIPTLAITGPVTAGTSNNSILEVIDTQGGLTVAGNLSAGGLVALGAEGGPLTQTAGAITTNTLEAISVGGATLTQSGNQFANLTFFENNGGGDVIVRDGQSLMLSGTLINDADGISIQTTGQMTLGAASISAPGGLELGSTGFVQTANVSISAQTPLVVIDATGAALPQTVNISSAASLLSSFVPGPASGNITLTTLAAPNAAVLLAANSGKMTGTIDARSLAVLGTGGSAQLFGNVGGIAGSTAAQIIGKSGRRENDYRFNNCAIGSVTCTVLPTIVPAKPAPVTNVSILTQQQFTDPLINLLNVGNEDLY